MDVAHKRFAAAVALFVVWVATLAVVAARSASRPVVRPAAAAQ